MQTFPFVFSLRWTESKRSDCEREQRKNGNKVRESEGKLVGKVNKRIEVRREVFIIARAISIAFVYAQCLYV